MSEWKVKRFWSEANVSLCAGGYSILLDSRSVKTPAKKDLIVPTKSLALAIAAEWNEQDSEINPQTMPITRSANAAIDKVFHQHAEVADLLSAYADADLLCYRADGPTSLVKRQAEAWDPLLDWAEAQFGARLIPVSGVMHRPQNPEEISRLKKLVYDMDAFTLTAFHDLVGISGSLVIGLAALHNYMCAEQLWKISRIDEAWQEEQWGLDEEAQEVAKRKLTEFVHAKTFFDLASKR